MTLNVDTEGNVTAIYNDDLRPVLDALGTTRIRRASHVEPDVNGLWWADLSPMMGPLLGPFALRADALAAEVAWLEVNLK